LSEFAEPSNHNKTASAQEHARYNVYGDPLPSDSKENGQVAVIPREGEFWGAAE
jgi:hypothetical protein